MMPLTIAFSVLRDGSKITFSGGFSPSPKNALPAASPNPLGTITAAARRPRRTASRASASVGVVTLKFLSPCMPVTIPLAIALPS